MMSAPAASASSTCSRLCASTSIGISGPASFIRCTAAATPPARRMWLSLIRMPSSSPPRWLVPPPARTAYFSSARSVGVVLRVSRTVMRAAGGVDEPPRQRRDAGQPLQEVERRPLGGQHRRAPAATSATTSPGSQRRRRRDARSNAHRRIELPEGLGRDVEAGDDARRLGQDDAARAAAPAARSPRS